MKGWAAARDDHRSRTRGRIIAAALELIAEVGMARVTMSLLASRSGVSRPTLYQHFPDVEHVVAAWVEDAMDAFTADVERVLTADVAAGAVEGEPGPSGERRSALARLERYVLAQCELFAGAQYGLRFAHFQAAGPHGPVLTAAAEPRLARLRDLIRGVLEEAATVGEVRRDLDPALAADVVFAVVDAIRPHVVAGRSSPSDAAAEVMALLRDGMGARRCDGPGDSAAGERPAVHESPVSPRHRPRA